MPKKRNLNIGLLIVWIVLMIFLFVRFIAQIVGLYRTPLTFIAFLTIMYLAALVGVAMKTKWGYWVAIVTAGVDFVMVGTLTMVNQAEFPTGLGAIFGDAVLFGLALFLWLKNK